jgi:hexosaminidase
MELLVHVDFKGLPLAPAYLCARFAELRAAGATGVLLEWEDMLPWSGALRTLARPGGGAYSAAEVEQVLACAAALGLEVVPLVQTLGHLEFALKDGRGFAHLREDSGDFGTICPVCEGTASLLQGMLAQVLAAHPTCARVHIGCDEPASLGASALTAVAVATAGGEAELLVEHITRVAAMARALGRQRQRQPQPCEELSVLMWHDAAVGMPPACLQRLLAVPGLELVVWDYGPALSEAVRAFVPRLRAAGARFHTATAFKGADACDALVPRAIARDDNQSAWRELLLLQPPPPPPPPPGEGRPAAGTAGAVVLTGWSRFGHLLPLTESWPAGMPSLLRALAVWTGGGAAAAHEAVRGWRANDAAGAAVYDAAVALEALAADATAFAEDFRTHVPPATARRPAPAYLETARVRRGALGARLAACGSACEASVGGGAIFRCDSDEWLAAKLGAVEAPLERAVLSGEF